MPLQEIVTPWDQQPQEWAEVDWGNPLARDLRAAFLPFGASMRDVVADLATAPTSASRSVATQAGMALTNDLTSNSGQVPYSARLAPTNAITVLFYGRTLTSGTYNVATEVSVNGWGAYGTGPNVYLRVGSAWADINVGGAAGDIACWGFTFDGSTFRAVRNGRVVGSQAISGTITHPNAGIMFGGTPQNPSLNGNSACSRLLVYGRALSADELAADYANVWQLFQRREWVPMAAGSGGGVTGASSGTLELSGSAAGSALVSGASAGTLAISGTAAAAVRVTGASSGTLSLTGTATGTVGATGVTGQSSQTLSLTGTSTATVRVSAQSAQTLALSGAAAGSVRVTGASAGTLSLTGTATATTTGAVAGASNGVLSLSGSATGTVRVSGGSAAVLQITGNAGAQIVVRGVSAGVLTMTGSATGTTGGAEPEPTAALAKYTITARARKIAIQAKARRMEIKA